MHFDILTIFPEIFRSFLAESLISRAIENKLLNVNLVNFRDFTTDKHHTVDDRPYGGGPGMVLKPEPLAQALDLLIATPPHPYVINLSPAGKLLNQSLVNLLSKRPRLILICGRYEGIDQRINDLYVNLNLSIGDYVLNGGEVPAMVVMEAIMRKIPGFLGEVQSTEEESFSDGLLEYPQYTRPQVFKTLEVPKILLSGNHREIMHYRQKEALARTLQDRPDLLDPDKGPDKDPDKEPDKKLKDLIESLTIK
ncbi:MAG: tRNA (guanosine(37)-N1)-methyltransferase TrmD [Deltaproteobacteria bacterium]|jgi:tRNA (guanine37-N1)-methyltransferase|nr:tRNA (guanosine(37)-N1)-methyltransferase TrmD [Deltaproteobacteria bacterium]